MKLGMVAVAGFALAGCVQQEFFVRQDVNYDRYQRDTAACATKATQEVSANTQVGWVPYVGVYSVDANAGLRQTNFEICMRDRGYSKVALPGCSANAGAAQQEGFGSTSRLGQNLKISDQSCFVLSPRGETLLYTPPAP